MDEDQLGTKLIGCSLAVNENFGPGLLESTYLFCLETELKRRGVFVESEVYLPIEYQGHVKEHAYRLDLWLERKVIVELKAVDEIHPVHIAQLLTYLKLTENKLGYIINFNTPQVKDGIKRVVNGL